jgi:hypothetical protein
MPCDGTVGPLSINSSWFSTDRFRTGSRAHVVRFAERDRLSIKRAWLLGEPEARRTVDPMTSLRCTLAAIVALLAVVNAAPASAGSDKPAGEHCVVAEEASILPAGDSGGEMKFSPAFFKRMYSLEVSLDGADGKELPISIETVCDVPKARKKEAAQLAGSDGVARVLTRTQIWEGDTLLTGTQASTALDGADTATMRVRLTQPGTWSEDEDGNPIPTFRAGRIEITD